MKTCFMNIASTQRYYFCWAVEYMRILVDVVLRKHVKGRNEIYIPAVRWFFRFIFSFLLHFFFAEKKKIISCQVYPSRL